MVGCKGDITGSGTDSWGLGRGVSWPTGIIKLMLSLADLKSADFRASDRWPRS